MTDFFSVEYRVAMSSVVRGMEVAIPITAKAAKAVVGTIAITQAIETAKAIAKASVVVAVVVAHCGGS